jgi:transketolase N-terminal domain/subunit
VGEEKGGVMEFRETKDLCDNCHALRDYYNKTGATHWASSRSVLSILMDIKKQMVDGDVCILSKAHAIPAYMLVFEQLPDKAPPTFFGSLGTALPFALGVAMARPDNTIYVVCGDGELQEGANLEALFAISRLHLKNIQVVVDSNDMQACQDTPQLIFPTGQFRQVQTYKGEDWQCHYKNP